MPSGTCELGEGRAASRGGPLRRGVAPKFQEIECHETAVRSIANKNVPKTVMNRKGSHLTKPPKHLSAAAKREFRRLEAEYEFGPDQRLILTVGFEGWDLANAANDLLRTQGLVLNGRRHPAAELQKQGTQTFLRCMRELGLNRSESGDLGRPPSEAVL